MQIDLSQLFITMPACYGKLDQGVNYTIQQVLDYIDELGDQISEMEAERELLQTVEALRRYVAEQEGEDVVPVRAHFRHLQKPKMPKEQITF